MGARRSGNCVIPLEHSALQCLAQLSVPDDSRAHPSKRCWRGASVQADAARVRRHQQPGSSHVRLGLCRAVTSASLRLVCGEVVARVHARDRDRERARSTLVLPRRRVVAKSRRGALPMVVAVGSANRW